MDDELRRLTEDVLARLTELVPDPDERARLSADLADALTRDRTALLRVLRAHPATGAVLESDQDRLVDQGGDVLSPLGVMFVCPNNDYAYVREAVGDEVPACPYDGAALVRYQDQQC